MCLVACPGTSLAGKGVYKFANGVKYSGDWVDNCKQGVGVFEGVDGSKYTGGFHNNLRHGQGIYLFANGDMVPLACSTRRDTLALVPGLVPQRSETRERLVFLCCGTLCSPTCEMSKQTGATASGEWIKGLLLHGTWTMPDGSKFTGTFANNLPKGLGGTSVCSRGVLQVKACCVLRTALLSLAGLRTASGYQTRWLLGSRLQLPPRLLVRSWISYNDGFLSLCKILDANFAGPWTRPFSRWIRARTFPSCRPTLKVQVS